MLLSLQLRKQCSHRIFISPLSGFSSKPPDVISPPCKQDLHCSGDKEEGDNKVFSCLAQKDALLKYLDLWSVDSQDVEQEAKHVHPWVTELSFCGQK